MNTDSGSSESGAPAGQSPAPASTAKLPPPAVRQQELSTAAQSPAETPRPGFSLRSLNDAWNRTPSPAKLAFVRLRRTPPGVRTAAPWVLLFLGLAFAGYAVVHYLTLQYRAENSPSATSIPGDEGIMTPPAPGMVSIRVSVRVRTAGSLAPIGTSLPRQIFLRMTGKDGQPYEARFDRAGVWGMEAPPGEYRISGKQKGLGDWSWELAGDCVKPATDLKNRYIVTLDLTKPFSTLDLTLK